MAEAVLMPKSGISVESCVIGTWKKSVGDAVAVGDVLFDYETDKAAFECESTADGVVLDIFYRDGDEVEVLKPVCAIGREGEDVAAIRAESGAAPVAEATVNAPMPETESGIAPLDAPVRSESSAPDAPAAPRGDAASVSPRARHAAERLGLYTGEIPASGPGGRVIERDVLAFANGVASVSSDVIADAGTVEESAPSESAEKAVPPSESDDSVKESLPLPAAGPYEDERFPKIRKLIATSMHASLQNTAQLTHHHSFDATEAQTARKAFKSNYNPAIAGVSIGDMILFAVSRVLPEHPDMNAHLVGGNTLRRFEHVNLGVAVDTPRGLMVPTVFGADRKSLIELSVEVKQLAAAARLGSIDPDLLQGGTFTVSNLGPTGVEMFTPILNPPQVGIFGVCGVTMKVRTTDKGIEAYPSIGMSLTYDHRAVDGAPASRFAQAVCDKLSQFSLLLDI
ncbi:MAG: 2-oxo acid dehydrogenase subunit E2 [Clostridiales Family XIII bacterium]|jgi:pyruvate dehydrogenase E2 component (dihydrolipoamide acetyltransferase)|nr:2-oxo acid dehydrogenase subunit E2 [Clostridiales Family XIII bacterium]